MSNSNPETTEVAFARYKKDALVCASSHLLSKLAGDESLNWHPLVADFMLLGKRLEQLGFIYNKGQVVVLEKERYE